MGSSRREGPELDKAFVVNCLCCTWTMSKIAALIA